MYVVRHSERLDKTSPDIWKASKRYKENPQDTPLSENGFKIAEKTIVDILKKDKREIGEIYCSPAERCIQTALEFQKEIQKKKGILVPIRIENGLIFDLNNILPIIKKFKKRSVVFGEEIEQIIFVDDYMLPKNIAKRFGMEKFDLEYRPIVSVEEINSPNRPEKQFNMRLNTVFDICERVDETKLNIAVTHQEIVCDTICQFCFRLKTVEELSYFQRKYFDYSDYCFWITVAIKNSKMKVISLKNRDGIHKITKKFMTSL